MECRRRSHSSLNWASGKTTNGLPMIRATVQEDINRDRTRMEYYRVIVKVGVEGTTKERANLLIMITEAHSQTNRMRAPKSSEFPR